MPTKGAATVRHFEKKGALGLFRRVDTKGATVLLAIGEASKHTRSFSIRSSSASAAKRLAATWARWALDAGYAEISLHEGTPGILFHLETPAGPGRVRDDLGRNVYFAPGAVEGPALRQGQRVVLHGVHRNPKLEVPFLFGSKLEARRLTAAPVPRWSDFRPRAVPAARVRNALVALAGTGIEGNKRGGAGVRDLPCGSLIFAYEKGVHRFLGEERGPDFDFVLSEPVLTSRLERQSGPVQSQVSEFCAPLPVRFRRELAKHYAIC